MTYQSLVEALAVPTRRTLLERLRRGPLPVGALAEGLAVSRPAVSQHLQVLKRAGLVSETISGTRHIYSVNPEGFADLRAYVDSFWKTALAEFKRAAEEPAAQQNTRVQPRNANAARGRPPARRRNQRNEGRRKR
jgi:DNA-binding transcriptional ArsR family regulator